MPFEVFRRNQKRVLAVLAILAMFLFTIDMSVMSLLNNTAPGGGGDAVVVQLDGKDVRHSDLQAISAERTIANNFVQAATGALGISNFFGGYEQRDLLDALLLRKEADRLNLPGGKVLAETFLYEVLPEAVPDYLRAFAGEALSMNPQRFEQIRATKFNNQYTGDAILTAIGDQYRLLLARSLAGPAQVTPLDIFEGFRAQTEKVSAVAVKLAAADYLTKVADPSDAELKSYFEQHKDKLPDPDRASPGFMVPRKVGLAVASVDAPALRSRLRAELVGRMTEIRNSFNERRPRLVADVIAEGKRQMLDGPIPLRLPIDVFALPANDPAQLQPRIEDFQDEIADELADLQARDAIDRMFDRLDAEAVDPFQAAYDAADDRWRDAQPTADGDDEAPTPEPQQLLDDRLKADLEGLLKGLGAAIPQPFSVAGALESALTRVASSMQPEGLSFTTTGLHDQAHLDSFGPISAAVAANEYPLASEVDPGTTFVAEVFGEDAALFTRLLMVDITGRRFAAYRLRDEAPRVPSFEEARAEILAAWKLDRASELAKAEAQTLADAAKAKGGDLRAVAGEKVPMTTIPLPRMQAAPNPADSFGAPLVRPAGLPDFDRPGEELRKALFDLQPGAVVVAPNAPEDTYYVLALASRDTSTVAQLYDFNNERELREVQERVVTEATRARIEAWMEEVRASGGLPAGWKPATKASGSASGEVRG